MSTEQIGELEVRLDVGRLVDDTVKSLHEPFTINLDIELPDKSIDPVQITGIIGIVDDRRYILFDKIEDGGTPLGNIQRRIARMNGLRIVDKNLMDWVDKKLAEKRKQRESKARTKALKKQG